MARLAVVGRSRRRRLELVEARLLQVLPEGYGVLAERGDHLVQPGDGAWIVCEPAAGLPADATGAVVMDECGVPVEQEKVEVSLVWQPQSRIAAAVTVPWKT